MRNRILSVTKITLCAAAIPVLVACGGGSGNSGSSVQAPIVVAPPTPPTSQANTWVQGQFAPASSFKDMCQTPRSGVDAVGNAFPDQSGTLSDELFWLRSWSDETYLWYDEITDRNPNDFTDKLAYFDELKTTATTPSGAPKDQFHFTRDTAEWLQLRTTGSSSGYGAEFVLYSLPLPGTLGLPMSNRRVLPQLQA